MKHHHASLRVLLTALVAAGLLAPAVTASAATTAWDPNDMASRFDLRWAGAYRQDADTIRLGIRVWRPVHRSDFDLRHGILVRMNPFGQDADAWVRPREGGGWMARFYDDGVSRALFHARVSHPVGTLFQLWLPASWARGQAITIQSVSPRGDDALELTAPR